jgi:hypothetical protein
MLESKHWVVDRAFDEHTPKLAIEPGSILVTFHCLKLQYELEQALAPAVQLTNNEAVVLEGLENCILDTELAALTAGLEAAALIP